MRAWKQVSWAVAIALTTAVVTAHAAPPGAGVGAAATLTSIAATAPGMPPPSVAVVATAKPAATPVAGSAPVTSIVVSPAIQPALPGVNGERTRLAIVSDGRDPVTVARLRHTLEQLGVDVIVVPLSGDAATAGFAVASAPGTARLSAPAASSVSSAVPIAWEGQLRYRYETRTVLDYRLPGTFGRASAGQTLGDRGDVSYMRTRVGANLRLAPGVRGYFNLQDARVMGAEGSPGGTLANVDLYNAYVDVDSLGARALTMRVGRQVLQYGDARLVSGSEWSNAGRGYDGARLRYAPRHLQLDGFLTWINAGRVSGSSRMFSGLDALWQPGPALDAEAYHFERAYGDMGWVGEAGNKGRLFDGTSGMRTRIVNHGVELKLEGAVQRGRRAGDLVKAWMGTGRVTFDLHSAWKTRVMVEHLRASGDHAPTDRIFQRFDPLFWGGHGLQGTLDIAGEGNLEDWCGGFTSQPTKAWTLQSELHSFALAQARDAWTDDAGNLQRRDTTGKAGTQVGTELDVTIKYDTRGKVSVLTGASRFWRGDYVKATGGGADMVWGFTQLNVAF